jgi:hypothetical protein
VRRPGIWKRAWKGAAGSFVESMLATNPVAYADYRRCKAGVDDQMALASEGPVRNASSSAAEREAKPNVRRAPLRASRGMGSDGSF